MTHRIDNTIRIRDAMTLLATTAILNIVPSAASAKSPFRRGGYTYYYPSTTTYRSAPSGYRGGYYYYYPSSRSYGTAPAQNRVSYYVPPTTTNATRPAATVAPAAAAPAATTATTAPAPAATTAAAPTPTGDPYGFTAWLNATRAQHGLPPVGYDPNLASWAAANNAQQNARGMGHHIMGPSRRQNCAMGHSGSIGSMWMNSPAHRANMLASDIRYIGIAGSGSYWTLNAY